MIRTMARKGLAGAAALTVGAFALSGCASDRPELVVAQPAPAGTAPAAVRLNEANMAALVLAANNATERRAQVEQARGADPEVRAYASRVLSESQTAGQVIRQQLHRHGIRPQPEQTSFQVESIAQQTVAEMERARGLEVDRIYLQSEIDNRRWLIRTLDSTMASTKNRRAREGLAQVRADLNAKLREAERLQARVKAEEFRRPAIRREVRPERPGIGLPTGVLPDPGPRRIRRHEEPKQYRRPSPK